MTNKVRMNRRELLQAAGATSLAALSGCVGIISNTSNPGSANATQTQGVIENTSIKGTELVVSLSPEADVEKVKVTGPNGSPSLGVKSISSKSTKVSFNILQSVPRGTHQVAAVSSDEVIGEASVDLQPDVQIDRVATGFQTDGIEWPINEKYDEVYLELSNRGNTPQQITYITMPEAPHSWPSKSESMFSGLQTLEGDTLGNITLSPNETKQVLTIHAPFLFGTQYPCGNSTNMNVILSTKIGENIKTTYRLITKKIDDSEKACRTFLTPASN